MGTAGLYITVGILIAVVLLVLYAAIKPHIRKYRVKIERIEPKKKTTRKTARKKKKSVWVKVI